MAAEIFKQHLIQKIEHCVQRAKQAGSIDHHGLAGGVRETLVSELLEPLLPEGFRIGSGKVIDANGLLSAETDVIIYNKNKFSPLMMDVQTGVYPIESVYYCIEVKTTVTSTEIKSSIKKAEKLRKLQGPQPCFVLFGFNSDTNDFDTEVKRIKEAQIDAIPPMNIFCVIGNGYGYFHSGKWILHGGGLEDRSEVRGLLAGIINTLILPNDKLSHVVPGQYFLE